MGNSISSNWMKFYDENILAFFQSLKDNPFSLFTAILDLAIVIFLLYAFFQNNQPDSDPHTEPDPLLYMESLSLQSFHLPLHNCVK